MRAPEVDLGECTLHFPLQKMRIRQNPLWLSNPEEMSPEIQNRGTSGLSNKDMCPPKTLKKEKKKIQDHPQEWVTGSTTYIHVCVILHIVTPNKPTK